MTDDELRNELAEAWCLDPAHDPVAVHGSEIDRLLPTVRRFADAQVAAERERIIVVALQQVADELSSYRWAGKAVAYIQGSTDRIASGMP